MPNPTASALRSMGPPTSAGHQRKHFARQRKSSGMRPTQNDAPRGKPFCLGIRASRQSKLINACSFHARPQCRMRKDDFARGKREAAGAPNPDGHAVQLHVMGGSIRHGHEIANCCSPLLEDMETNSRSSWSWTDAIGIRSMESAHSAIASAKHGISPRAGPCARARSAQNAASSHPRKSARNTPRHQSHNAANDG